MQDFFLVDMPKYSEFAHKICIIAIIVVPLQAQMVQMHELAIV